MNTKVKLTEQELQDIWSALSFFVREYPSPAPQTKRAMNKIIKKIQGKPQR